jgi:hypothetical protein
MTSRTDLVDSVAGVVANAIPALPGTSRHASRADRGRRTYAVSESCVVVRWLGALNRFHRPKLDRKDLMFRGSVCRSGIVTHTLNIPDPGGSGIAFALTSSLPECRGTPGRTPLSIHLHRQIPPDNLLNEHAPAQGTIQNLRPKEVRDPIFAQQPRHVGIQGAMSTRTPMGQDWSRSMHFN